MVRIQHPDPVLNADFYADVTFKRFIAWLIDAVIITLITALIVPFTAFTALFFLPALWIVVGFVYRVITLSGGSATLGMRIMAIRFYTWDGRGFGLGEAFLHTLIYSLAMSFVLPQVVSVGLMILTDKGQSLGDLLLGSVAINRAAER